MTNTYTVEPGRIIVRDGKPIASLGRIAYETPPDAFAHEVVAALNALPELVALLRTAACSAQPLTAPLGPPLTKHVDKWPQWVVDARALLATLSSASSLVFELEDTGGGCSALVAVTSTGRYVLTSDDGATAPDDSTTVVLLGYYEGDDWSEGGWGDMQHFESVREAMDAAELHAATK